MHTNVLYSIQQLANIAVKGTNERRYFTGVDGDKERKGELFGLENLFSYRAEGASLSKDIVKRTEKLEAGFRVAKYEIEHERRKPEDNALNEVSWVVKEEQATHSLNGTMVIMKYTFSCFFFFFL